MTNFEDYALELIKEGEGFVGVVYGDLTGKPLNMTEEGIPTIGYGTNLNVPVDEKICSLMLEDRIQDSVEQAKKFDFFEGLSYRRKAVIIDLIYNMGLYTFNQFNHFIWAMNERNWEEAGDGLFYSNYWKQVGSRAIRNLCIIFDDEEYTKSKAIKRFNEIKNEYGWVNV